MTINEYQEYVKQGANPVYDDKLAVIGLLAEAAEVADLIKKKHIYNDLSKFEAKYGKSYEEKILDECGDCLWQYMLLLSKFDLTVDQVIEYNVAKLNERHGGAGKTAVDGGGVR